MQLGSYVAYNDTILEHGLKFILYLALSCGSGGSINASLLPGGERSDVIKSEHCSQLLTCFTTMSQSHHHIHVWWDSGKGLPLRNYHDIIVLHQQYMYHVCC